MRGCLGSGKDLGLFEKINIFCIFREFNHDISVDLPVSGDKKAVLKTTSHLQQVTRITTGGTVPPMCVCVCVRASARACVCVRACVYVYMSEVMSVLLYTSDTVPIQFVTQLHYTQ